MALSRIEYVADGATDTFVYPFGYLDESHITVLVNLVTADFSFLSSNTVQLDVTPANGDSVLILRETPKTELIVDFVNGSELDADDFDLANTQLLYILQENQDLITEGVVLFIPDATEEDKGIARFATNAEAIAGTLDNVMISPKGLSAAVPSATTTTAGKVRKATNTEVDNGSAVNAFVTPDQLQTKIDEIPGGGTVPDASETTKGIARLATEAETTAGTNDETIVTPLKLQQKLDSTEISGIDVGAMIESYQNPNSTFWVQAQGQELDQTTYADLFSVLGDDSRILTGQTASATDPSGFLSNPNAYAIKFGSVYLVSSGQTVYSSTTLTVWANENVNTEAGLTRFAKNSTTVFAVGTLSIAAVPGDISYSSDGLAWSTTNIGANVIVDIFSIGETVFAVDTTGAVKKTTDGISWSAAGTVEDMASYIPFITVEHLNSAFHVSGDIGGEGSEARFYEFNGTEIALTRALPSVIDFDVDIRFGYNEHFNEIGVILAGGGLARMLRINLQSGRNTFNIVSLPGVSNGIPSIKWISGEDYLIGTDNSGIFKTDLMTIDAGDFGENQNEVFSITRVGDELLTAGQDTGTSQPLDVLNLSFDATNFLNADAPLNFPYPNRVMWIKFD